MTRARVNREWSAQRCLNPCPRGLLKLHPSAVQLLERFPFNCLNDFGSGYYHTGAQTVTTLSCRSRYRPFAHARWRKLWETGVWRRWVMRHWRDNAIAFSDARRETLPHGLREAGSICSASARNGACLTDEHSRREVRAALSVTA
jgi:hypothetical protein